MRFLSMIRVDEHTGQVPSEQLMQDMGKLMDEMTREGTLVRTAGLRPSAEGRRVRLHNGQLSTIDGPFSETKELIAGFWLWQVKNMEEAVEWARRCPDPMPGEDAELEIRQIASAEDFGAEFTPELQEQENKLRSELERQQKKA